MTLEFTRWTDDFDGWAAALRISREAVEIFAASESIDLHIESFIWSRIGGYDLSRRHGRGLFGARFYSQVDLPRLLESGLSASVWSIATNPLRRRSRRTTTLLNNLARLRAAIEEHAPQLEVVTDHAGYCRARAAGRHACFLAIQGGNALGGGAEDLASIPDNCVSRITLVHLSNSNLGQTSSPLGGEADPVLADLKEGSPSDRGLTDAGRDFIAEMNRLRMAVDLAHINEPGFWQALEVHDRTQPVIVSHTGVCAVHDSWRNLTDGQIKAIAASGGVIGIIFHSYFLNGSQWGGARAADIVDHLEQVVAVAGEDFAALGSDWDGLITTPRDMPTVLEIPVLVQRMLDRGWSADRIGKILGGNYLRVMRELRPGLA